MTERKIFFNLGGITYYIADLEHLINNEFISLHQSFFGLPAINLSKFRNISLHFFDSIKNNANKWALHDKYFNNFTIIWTKLLNQRKFIEAERIWEMALNIINEWEQKTQERIHKGTPYYFWAVTCFLKDDIETGFWLMNQAFLEDILTHQTNEPNTAAKYFLYFNTEPAEQFFKPKLNKVKAFLSNYIKEYNASRTRSLSYDNFVHKFLKEPDISKEIKFHFNFNIFKLEKILNRFPKPSNNNTISSLFYLEIIFDLCKVLEFFIKNPNRDNFLEDIKDLAVKFNPNSPVINVISRDFHTNNFMPTLKEILDNRYNINNDELDELEKDILITYGFRNFGAHRIEENRIIIENFENIIKKIMNVIFYAIDVR